MRGLLAASLLIAALSLLAGFTLDYDPWNWTIWGRDLVHGTFDTRSATAWKPLPVMFTTLFALAGHAAPALWILLTRASAVLALALGYRLAARFGGPAAGVAAVLGLLSVDHALQWSALGNSEALLLALVLGAAEAHLAGCRTYALWLGFAAALLRPEAWPFYYAYGALSWQRDPATRAHVLGLGAAVPLLWFVPQWVGSGDPLAGSHLALTSPDASSIRQTSQPWLTVLRRAQDMLPRAVEWVALLTVAWSVRRRERGLVLAGLAVVVWVGLVAGMAQAGYPGISRYLFAPAGVTAVLGSIGIGRLVRAPSRPVWRVALAIAAVAAIGLPAAAATAPRLGHQWRIVAGAIRSDGDMAGALRRAGGAGRLLRCGNPSTTPLQVPALHWALGRRPGLEDHGRLATPAAFFEDSGPPVPRAPEPLERSLREVARVGRWQVRAECLARRSARSPTA